METTDRIPWLEYKIKNKDYANLPLPHVFATHLPYYLVPRDLRNKRGRVSDVIFTISLKPIMPICVSEFVQILPFSSFSSPCLGINITCFIHVGQLGPSKVHFFCFPLPNLSAPTLLEGGVVHLRRICQGQKLALIFPL